MNWTHDGQRWTLSAAPRYAVERQEARAFQYVMFIDGHEVDSTSTAAQAQGALEARYEYEAHISDLEEARRRLRQVHERLEARYPRVARDPQLASVLECLGDALGTGPEASDPETAKAAETDLFRQQLSPDFWIVVDASTTVVFEVTTPHGRVLRRIAVSPTTVALVMGDAAMCARLENEEADARRYRGPDEKRRAEGRLDQPEAVEYIIGAGLGEGRAGAVAIVNWLKNPLNRWEVGEVSMTYDGTYWVVPAQQG